MIRAKQIVALFAAILPSVLGIAAEIAIVSGDQGEVSAITRDEAERLYLGRTTTLPDNRAVTLIDLPPGPVRDAFYLRLTGKNPVQTRANWSRQVFTGRALPPRQAESSAQVHEWLVDDPNAIGYLPSDEIGSGLRILLRISD